MTEPSIEKIKQFDYEQKLDAASRPLFKAISSLAPAHDTTLFREFEQFIKAHYHKDKIITRQYLNLWSGRFGVIRPLSKWLFSAAVDFLIHKGINPITIIAPEKIAEHWIRPRRKWLSLDEALQQFMHQFNPLPRDRLAIQQVITAMYAKPLPLK